VPAVREILIGRRTGDHVVLAVRGRLFPEGEDPDWLWTTLSARLGGFGCQLEGGVRAAELRGLRTRLEGLHDGSATEAALATEDDWLSLELASDADAIGVVLRVHDQAGPPPNELRGHLDGLSRDSLVAAIETLREVERAYPADEKPVDGGDGRRR
jgi:hypothetical protein